MVVGVEEDVSLPALDQVVEAGSVDELPDLLRDPGPSASGGAGDDRLLVISADDAAGGVTTVLGGPGADVYHVQSATAFADDTLWIMDFEPGVDRSADVDFNGRALDDIATQHGEHLLLDFGAGNGGRIWLAWTNSADLDGVLCAGARPAKSMLAGQCRFPSSTSVTRRPRRRGGNGSFFPRLGDRVAFLSLDRLWGELIAPSRCRARSGVRS